MTKTEYERNAESYLAALPSMNKSIETEKAYRQTLLKFASQLPPHAEITPLSVVEFRIFLFESGVKTNTVGQHLIRLHAFFEWCKRMNLCRENPVVLSEVPTAQPVTYSMLTAEQIEKIESYKPDRKRKTLCRNYCIVATLIQTGLRNSELRALTLQDLDFEGGTVRVLHGKGDKQRFAPFPPLSQSLIREYLNSGMRPSTATDDDPLFGTTSDADGHNGREEWHAMTSQTLNKIVKTTVKKITGADIHTHLLRHCATSRWAEMDVPMRTVQLALGHARLSTTEQVYAHVLRRERAAQGINDAYQAEQLRRTEQPSRTA